MQWVHLHPSRAVKKLGRNLQGKFVSAPPAHQVHPEAEQFRAFFAGRGDLEVYLVVLDRLLRATTKKVVKICTPDKILATPIYTVTLRNLLTVLSLHISPEQVRVAISNQILPLHVTGLLTG